MSELAILFNIIHECNLLAGITILDYETAEYCSTVREYTLQEYFNGSYETYKVAYEKFIESLTN